MKTVRGLIAAAVILCAAVPALFITGALAQEAPCTSVTLVNLAQHENVTIVGMIEHKTDNTDTLVSYVVDDGIGKASYQFAMFKDGCAVSLPRGIDTITKGIDV